MVQLKMYISTVPGLLCTFVYFKRSMSENETVCHEYGMLCPAIPHHLPPTCLFLPFSPPPPPPPPLHSSNILSTHHTPHSNNHWYCSSSCCCLGVADYLRFCLWWVFVGFFVGLFIFVWKRQGPVFKASVTHMSHIHICMYAYVYTCTH